MRALHVSLRSIKNGEISNRFVSCANIKKVDEDFSRMLISFGFCFRLIYSQLGQWHFFFCLLLDKV